MKLQTLKGFRDFLPAKMRKRQYVINILKQVFESYGFEPLETPALEYEEILLGKYGEEGDKLMYRFTDRGKRKVALRYDQTVPLARVVAQYGNGLPMPFKRYQIQNVWRSENTQKGRFREFLQCDADIVGSNSPLSDAETITVAAKSLEKLGFKNFKILINAMSVFKDTPENSIRIIDKLKKIGEEGVIKELIASKITTTKDQATSILRRIEVSKPNNVIAKIISYLNLFGIQKSKYEFYPTLARGLNYYTGMIFEIEIEGYPAGSVCGGGRYDNLIGMFAKKPIPAVGFAFGFDRLMEAMDELNLFPQNIAAALTKALVTIFSPKLIDKSIETTLLLRRNKVPTELYLDENSSLDKQLKYADKKGIPYVIIIGDDEAKSNKVSLKNLISKTQEKISIKDAINKLNSLQLRYRGI